MAKAMLIMDMPSSCIECPMCYKAELMCIEKLIYEQLYRCRIEPQDLEDVYLDDVLDKRQEWCPLPELPHKKESSQPPLSPLLKTQYTEYERGYNACIDDILGSDES